MSSRSASVAIEEITQFSRHAEDWWNPEGKFKPLHRLNPVRLQYIRDQICAHTGRKIEKSSPLKGLKILDIGCGGGLITEPLARLGGQITGVDASDVTVNIARHHAKNSGLTIDYRVSSVEDLAKRAQGYDVITALEIIEHVADSTSFLQAIAKLLNPGGLLIMSTLNRTPKSFLLGIVAAEYVMGWVPRGTHQWSKFVRPSELVQRLRDVGFSTHHMTGLVFNPLLNAFQLQEDDLAVNYLLTATNA